MQQVSAFIDSEDPVRLLTDTHVLEFGPECEVYKENRATNAEIQHLCSGEEGLDRKVVPESLVDGRNCGGGVFWL